MVQCSYYIDSKSRQCKAEAIWGSKTELCKNHKHFTSIFYTHPAKTLWDALLRRSSTRALEYIIGGQFDLNEVSGYYTPLTYALEKRMIQVIEALVARPEKVDFGLADQYGRTPLMVACEYRLTGIALDILKTGKSRPDATEIYGQTALMIACDKKLIDVADAIFKTGNSNPTAFSKMNQSSAFSLACDNNMSIALDLMEMGFADLKKTYSDGETILMHLARRNSPAIMRAVIKTGEVDPGALSHGGRTALVVACESRNTSAAKILLETGKANPGAVYVNRTVLLMAFEKNERLLALDLIKSGQSNPSFVGRNNKSALDLACELRWYDVISALIATGDCGIDRPDRNGISALEYCQRKGFPEQVIQEIFEATTDRKILLKFLVNSEGGMKLLLDKVNFDTLMADTRSPDYACAICHNFCGQVYSHSCGAQFHKSCISGWVTQPYGTVISAARNKCPNCRGELDIRGLDPNRKGRIMTTKEIEKLDKNSYHKICKPCRKIFVCGVRSLDSTCGDNTEKEMLLPDNCDSCVVRTFDCPKCGITLEHNGDCRQFSCCMYGADKCRQNGRDCDHGSTEFAKFCGYTWTLDERLIQGNYYEDDDYSYDTDSSDDPVESSDQGCTGPCCKSITSSRRSDSPAPRRSSIRSLARARAAAE